MHSTTVVVGNIVNDIDLKFTNAGKAFASVTVAVNEKKFNKQTNQYEDGETWFARGILWGGLAENVHQSLGKGSRAIGHGRLKQRNFETKDGDKRSVVEIEFEAFGPDLRFATAQVTRTQARGQGGGFGGGSAQGQGDWAQPPANGAQTKNTSEFGGGFDDEQPF